MKCHALGCHASVVSRHTNLRRQVVSPAKRWRFSLSRVSCDIRRCTRTGFLAESSDRQRDAARRKPSPKKRSYDAKENRSSAASENNRKCHPSRLCRKLPSFDGVVPSFPLRLSIILNLGFVACKDKESHRESFAPPIFPVAFVIGRQPRFYLPSWIGIMYTR